MVSLVDNNWTIQSDTYLLNPNLEADQVKNIIPCRSPYKVKFEEFARVKRFQNDWSDLTDSTSQDSRCVRYRAQKLIAYPIVSTDTDTESSAKTKSGNSSSVETAETAETGDTADTVDTADSPTTIESSSVVNEIVETTKGFERTPRLLANLENNLQVCIHCALEDAPLPKPRLMSPVDRARKAYFTPAKRRATVLRAAAGGLNESTSSDLCSTDPACCPMNPQLQNADIIIPIIEMRPNYWPASTQKLRYPVSKLQNAAAHQYRINAFMEKHEGVTIPQCHMKAINTTQNNANVKVMPRHLAPFDPFNVKNKSPLLVCTRCCPRVKYFMPKRYPSKTGYFSPRSRNPKCWPYVKHQSLRNSFLDSKLCPKYRNNAVLMDNWFEDRLALEDQAQQQQLQQQQAVACQQRMYSCCCPQGYF